MEQEPLTGHRPGLTSRGGIGLIGIVKKKFPSLALFSCLFIMAAPLYGEDSEEPLKLETLTTTKGKVYRNLTVREVTPSGIKIFHEGGSATLPYELLPEDLRKMVGGFDPEKAAKFRADEDRKLTAQEQQLERELQKLKKSEPAPAPAPAEPASPPPASPEDGNGPAAPATPETGAKAPPKDKGELTARIVGYRTGAKRVEFKVHTNCAARLEVHNVVPDGRTEIFEVTAKTPFTREVWVFNDYSSDLYNLKDEKLDAEASRQKTKKGKLTTPTLR